MSRYRYNRQVELPAPFVHVALSAPREGLLATGWAALLDTAANISVVPWRVVEERQLEQLGDFEAIGLDGHIVTIPNFLIQNDCNEIDKLRPAVEMIQTRAKGAVVPPAPIIPAHSRKRILNQYMW